MLSLSDKISAIDDLDTLKQLLRHIVADPDLLQPSNSPDSPDLLQPRNSPQAPTARPVGPAAFDTSEKHLLALEELRYQDLQALEQLSKEWLASKQSLHAQKNQTEKAHAQLAEAELTVKRLVQELADVSADRKRLAIDKTHLLQKLNALPANNTLTSNQQNSILHHDSQELTEKNAQLQSQVQKLLLQTNEQQALLEEYRHYKTDNQELNELLNDTSANLDSCREHISQLEAKINMLSSPNLTHSTDISESKSLLGEMDDQRKKIESSHSMLLNAHSGLLKSHTKSIHEQQRMKNHINRLSQLSSRTIDGDGVRALKESLSQSEAEKKAQSVRILQLEKELSILNDCKVSHSLTTYQRNDFFQQRLKVLQKENEKLKKECQSQRLLKLAEDDKLRKLEAWVLERDIALDEHKSKLAELSYLYEELKLAKKESNELVAETNELVTVAESNELVTVAESNESVAESNELVVESNELVAESNETVAPKPIQSQSIDPLKAKEKITMKSEIKVTPTEKLPPVPLTKTIHVKKGTSECKQQ